MQLNTNDEFSLFSTERDGHTTCIMACRVIDYKRWHTLLAKHEL